MSDCGWDSDSLPAALMLKAMEWYLHYMILYVSLSEDSVIKYALLRFQ